MKVHIINVSEDSIMANLFLKEIYRVGRVNNKIVNKIKKVRFIILIKVKVKYKTFNPIFCTFI